VSVPLYMDVHVPAPITRALLARGVDVLTSQADETTRLPDAPLLDRVGQLGRVLFTRDEDFLAEVALRQRRGETFAGIIYGHQLRVSIRQCTDDLELIAKCCQPDDLQSTVQHLPLR
jgi:hypothetical protein